MADHSQVARLPRHRHPDRAGVAPRTRRRLATLQQPRRPAIGATLRNRQLGQPDHVLAISWRAQHRLHHRLTERNKPSKLATVAVARELAGFLWAAATAP